MLATTPPTDSQTLGATALMHADAAYALANLVRAVRALPTTQTPLRAQRRWWETLLGLPSPAERAQRAWDRAAAHVDRAADGLHQAHAALRARLRAAGHGTPSTPIPGTPHTDPTHTLVAAHMDGHAQLVLAHAEDLEARIAHILDHALPLWETQKGLRPTGQGTPTISLAPSARRLLLDHLA